MADANQDPLKKGSNVEVSSDDEGLRGSWYTATVLRARSRRSKKIFVEYHRLMADEEGTKPLREFVDWILLRPAPPREPPGSVRFALSDEVDAFHNDGWWEGVVTEVLEGSRYSVFFRCSHEQIQFNEDELRLHREWVHGEWVPPLVDEQESRTTEWIVQRQLLMTDEKCHNKLDCVCNTIQWVIAVLDMPEINLQLFHSKKSTNEKERNQRSSSSSSNGSKAATPKSGSQKSKTRR